jgi:hypothetical protein
MKKRKRESQLRFPLLFILKASSSIKLQTDAGDDLNASTYLSPTVRL